MAVGWVDLDMGSSPGWWAAGVATYCPSRVVDHSKSKSTKPSPRAHGTPCMYINKRTQRIIPANYRFGFSGGHMVQELRQPAGALHPAKECQGQVHIASARNSISTVDRGRKLLTRARYFISLCVFARCCSADFVPRLPCKIIINNVEIRKVRRKIWPC